MGEMAEYYEDLYEEQTFNPRRALKRISTPPTQAYLDARERLVEGQLERIERMRQEREEWEAWQARIKGCMPAVDDFENGAMLLIEKRYIQTPGIPDVQYTYSALKIADRWFITGTKRVHSGQSYEWLLDFVAFQAEDAPKVWIVTELKELEV